MAKRDPFIAVDTVEVNGKSIRVCPLKFIDAPKVEEYLKDFNPEAMALVFMYEDSRKSAAEVVKLATGLSDDEIGQFSIYDFEEIVSVYLGLSKLKKKMEQ